MEPLLLEPPRKEARPSSTRAAAAASGPAAPRWSGDVGSFYPSTNNAALTVWSHVMQAGPAMYQVDAVKLPGKWRDYVNAWTMGWHGC